MHGNDKCWIKWRGFFKGKGVTRVYELQQPWEYFMSQVDHAYTNIHSIILYSSLNV